MCRLRGHFVAIALSLGVVGVIAQTQPVAVYIKAPRTSADPRAKLVKDLRDYLKKSAKKEVRIVDSGENAQLVVDVSRPNTSGTPVPYVESAAGDDRVTAAALYVVAARVCVAGTDRCSDLSASARLNSMATMQLGERIKKLSKENATLSK